MNNSCSIRFSSLFRDHACLYHSNSRVKKEDLSLFHSVLSVSFVIVNRRTHSERDPV